MLNVDACWKRWQDREVSNNHEALGVHETPVDRSTCLCTFPIEQVYVSSLGNLPSVGLLAGTVVLVLITHISRESWWSSWDRHNEWILHTPGNTFAERFNIQPLKLWYKRIFMTEKSVTIYWKERSRLWGQMQHHSILIKYIL